jgi:hypothetical protein
VLVGVRFGQRQRRLAIPTRQRLPLPTESSAMWVSK